MCIYIYIYIYIFTSTYTYVYVYIYIHAYVYIYIYVYIYMYSYETIAETIDAIADTYPMLDATAGYHTSICAHTCVYLGATFAFSVD